MIPAREPGESIIGEPTRTRWTVVVAVVIAVAMVVAGLAIVSARGSNGATSAPEVIDDAPAATDDVPVSPATDAPSPTSPTTEAADEEAAPPTATEPVPATDGPAVASDPADRYLDRTTEIYRRDVPGGLEMVVRRSDVSYAELFGYTWRAPTGSAELCLGTHALFFGDPTRRPSPGYSAWELAALFADRGRPGTLVTTTTRPEDDGYTYFLFHVPSGATEIAAERYDGTELDRAPVVNQVAVLGLRNRDVYTDLGASGEPVAIRFVGDAANPDPIGLDDPALWLDRLRDECGPGPSPTLPFPEPGEQPADPVAAEAEVRARHALLVDRSITDDERPDDLLDDTTGVADAVDRARRGPYADSVAAAQYTIDRLVFTSPAEAFFEYTIDAPTGVFANRYGIARFNGDVWQITRSTLCQDLRLALAGGQCEPTPVPEVVEPPRPPDWDERWREWTELANLYIVADGCGPLGGC